MNKKIIGMKSLITGGALVLATGAVTAGVASAATHTTLTSSRAAGVLSISGRDGTEFHGPDETPVTGTVLARVTASANAAVPNATVLGAHCGPAATYEVGMRKADGTYVTVIEDSSFVVTSTRTGLAPRPGFGDPATMAHGPRETRLTGSALSSAGASAIAAVPGATVLRAETDAQGAAYEVHLKKSDGTFVTVKENSSFVVTSTQAGFATPAGVMPGERPDRWGPPRGTTDSPDA